MATAWTPTGTTYSNNPDGSLLCTLPSGWAYVGYDTNGALFDAAAGSTTVSCTCNGTGSCSPFYGHGPDGDTQGCAGNCSSCLMQVSTSNKLIANGGWLNTSIPTAFVLASDSGSIPGTFPALFDWPTAQSAINSFLSGVYQGYSFPDITIDANGVATLPAGYSFALINIMGRGATFPVPNASIIAGGAAGGSGSCSCTKGSCSAQKQSVDWLGWYAISCTGSCTGTCSLTVSSSVEGPGYSSNAYDY